MNDLTTELRRDQHEALDRLEVEIARMPEAKTQLFHHFADGIYARELHLPAGTALTGKVHRTRHINIVSKGRILISAVGEESREIVAPACFVSESGTRRAGMAIEDTIWTTFHATTETDVGKIEQALVESHENPFLDYETRSIK